MVYDCIIVGTYVWSIRKFQGDVKLSISFIALFINTQNSVNLDLFIINALEEMTINVAK